MSDDVDINSGKSEIFGLRTGTEQPTPKKSRMIKKINIFDLLCLTFPVDSALLETVCFD